MLSFLPVILYFFGLLAFIVVVVWALINDTAGTGGGARGLLAMRGEAPPERRRRIRRF